MLKFARKCEGRKEKKMKYGSLEIGRRNFIKYAAMSGAAFCMGNAPASESGKLPEKKKLGSAAVLEKFRTLGSGAAAMKVSALGFGCMGLNYHRGAHPGRKACIRLIREAAERGVNFFDTAEGYGPFTNELIVGEALKGYSDRVFICTKFGHKYENGRRVMGEEDSSPASIRRACEGSLRRLGVEAIGIFYQHRADPKTPPETVAETAAELIKEGKVLKFGMCEVGASTIRRAHAVCPITAIQSEYHLMHRTVEDNGVLAACRELGIGFVPYSPINRGFLGGLINEYSRFEGSDNRRDLPRFQPDAIRANLRIVEILNEFGRPRGLTSAQAALAWLMSKSPNIVPIPGTTKLSHLEENLRSADAKLSESEIAGLEDSISKIEIVGARYNAEQQRKVES